MENIKTVLTPFKNLKTGDVFITQPTKFTAGGNLSVLVALAETAHGIAAASVEFVAEGAWVFTLRLTAKGEKVGFVQGAKSEALNVATPHYRVTYKGHVSGSIRVTGMQAEVTARMLRTMGLETAVSYVAVEGVETPVQTGVDKVDGCMGIPATFKTSL